MKPSIAVLSLVAIFCVMTLTGSARACVGGPVRDSFSSDATAGKNYEWLRRVAPGKGCFPEECAEGQWPMAIVPLVAFDDKLWMVGQKSVWSSVDGVRWNAQPKTDWGERYGMSYVFFDNKIWMMGGMRAWDDFRNDVWYSTDGRNWKQATTNAGWSPRRGHSALVFNNRMWVMGGSSSSGSANQLPARALNDVWSSTDGVQWTLATENAPWAARDDHISLVFKNKLWVIGGEGRRDVWSSVDGHRWTQATSRAEWRERQNNGGLVFDGKLWIFGGRGLNDVWYSTDGARWIMNTANAPWSTRTAFHSVAFDNKLWIYSGKTGRQDSWSGDVWVMSPSVARASKQP